MLTDGSGGCFFATSTGLNNWRLFDWLNAATGWEKTPDEYMEIGHRIQTLRQMFNIKHGIKPIRYKMHDRISGASPLEQGPLSNISLDIENMMKKYWKVNGWDEKTGNPKSETKKKLNLDKL